MNKVILSLLLAVCILGMALIMLNERLGRKPEPTTPEVSESAAPEVSPLPPLQADARPDLPTPAAPQEAASEEPTLPPLPQDEDPKPLPATGQATSPAPPPAAQQASPSAPPPAPERPAAKAEAVATPRPETKKEQSPPAEKPKEEKAPAEKPKAEKPKADAEKPKAEKATPSEPTITRFVVFVRDKGATVRMVGNASIRYKSMQLSNPERVVVDLDGLWQIKAPGVPANPLVSNVRIGKIGGKTRVVIDLKEKPRSSRLLLSKEGDTLDLRVDQ